MVYDQDFQPRLDDTESGSANIRHTNFFFETDLFVKLRNEKKSNEITSYPLFSQSICLQDLYSDYFQKALR